MIKLERGDKPEELTKELKDNLTQEFEKTGKSVWNEYFIKEALLKFSHNKCCYCETRLDIKSDYMEVEHFRCKKKYSDKVVEWENLLPSCKRCNGKKSEHDVEVSPIINPVTDYPRDYLYFKDSVYKSKKRIEIGRQTIETLDLNDDRIFKARIELAEKIHDELSDICDLIEEYDSTNNRRKNKTIKKANKLLSLALPEKEYSALAATIILEDDYFEIIKTKMIEYELWNDELTELENSAKNICLSLKI